MSYREGRFWQPDVTVATIVVRDGQLLMVEERANGALVLNQPAGHLEPDESLLDAALRETREETGWEVRLTAFVGAYQWKAPLQADGSGGPGPPLPHDWVQLVSVCCVLCTHFCHQGPQSLRRWKPPSTLMTSPVE